MAFSTWPMKLWNPSCRTFALPKAVEIISFSIGSSHGEDGSLRRSYALSQSSTAHHVSNLLWYAQYSNTEARRISQSKDTVHLPAPKNAVVSYQVLGALPQHSIRFQDCLQGSAKAQMVSSMAHVQCIPHPAIGRRSCFERNVLIKLPQSDAKAFKHTDLINK